MRRLPALLICAIFPLLGGCGDGGASAGASVSVYVAASLCGGAKRELAREGGRAGDLRVYAVCLADPERRGRLDLATIGANARRASEDSTSVAYLDAPDPQVARFTRPILESAEIAWLITNSGSSGMRHVLEAARDADSASLRKSLWDSLSG